MAKLAAAAVAVLSLFLGAEALGAESALAAPCEANPIVCENEKPGNPTNEWDVEGAGDPSIQGFATDISVNRGETVHFKIKTDSSAYHLDVYRMGYYGGDGARKVTTVQPSASLPQSQPACDEEASTGLIDCGNWAESASWEVPADAVSGIYFAKLVRTDQPSEGSHIPFIVRDDESHSALLFQTADTTWEAYNRYGGSSLYTGGPGSSDVEGDKTSGTAPGRAYKVSYNRPLTVRGTTPEDDPFNAEYPMVRWLERNGYDVSYFTGVDADRRGAEIQNHKVYLSVGHDEYWSGQQRANVEAAREAGVNLAFFSGNEIFWKTRWEDSIDGSGTDHRTLACYKETHANAKIDPEPNVWTGTWRDPRFSPPADGGRPENSLSGQLFTVDVGTSSIQVPAADGKLRLWRNTSVASLKPGETATLGEETLGYEWDEDVDNGFRPPGLMDLSSTTTEVPEKLQDFGSTYASGTATHHLTLYRAASGALVFGAGTVQWSWGLDGEHDRGNTTPDPRMQQATVNLLAEMEARPGTLQEDLVPASRSTDVTPPTTTITGPLEGENVESGLPVTITGTASDQSGEGPGGQVAGVEVSVDGGSTWHPATGRENWSYSWTPTSIGSVAIRARAVDDSANLESPGAHLGVNVVQRPCPCSIWSNSFSAPQDLDTSGTELGVRFRSDASGFITGLRFYKTAGNTGTHVGRLWSATGTQLARATFVGESASGWQEVTFDNPVPVEAGTTYVASYHAPNGHYASIPAAFATAGVDNPPLHALKDGQDGPNGMFKYGPSGGLFSNGGPDDFGSANYLVDVVFANTLTPDTTPPTIASRVPDAGATGVARTADLTATFNERMNAGTVNGTTVELRGPGGASVDALVTYNAAARKVTVDPVATLQASTDYTVTIKGGANGVTDLAGNAMEGDSSWTITTVQPPPPAADDGPGGPILVIANSTDPFSRYYAEILRAQGLNEFRVSDLSTVTPAELNAYDVVILGETGLSVGQAAMFTEWVQQGGNLIAMRPDPQLAGLLGLGATPDSLSNGYLKVNTASGPGAGIVNQTIQFHGTADRYTLGGAEAIATLFSDANTATANPAVTLRSVGSKGGQAAAFTYDLAKSVVYTRQGNPAWAGEDRDGSAPIRSDDLFYGAEAGDVRPDWVDLNKVAIPQADEQQRLLTNLIEEMNVDRKPLPSFWFLPRDMKAAVVMTGDDHGNGGTAGRFDKYMEDSPPGCVVANWECVRATSYIYPETASLSNAEAAAFQSQGFEIALHVLTNCEDWNGQANLESLYSGQLAALAANYPSLGPPSTERTHCVTWSDWATQPKVELENGIRLDTNYYYWPGEWVQDRPGMFTGSGMPMRFADLNGSMINVYQAATQMTDESGQSYPFTINTLLDRALGPEGYYGVFTANMHTDAAESSGSDAIVAAAQARGVPVVSARQILTWLDGRNNSSFGSIQWNARKLEFTIDHAAGANGLRAMVPTISSIGTLTDVKLNGSPVATISRVIKGREYAFFDAAPGSYEAIYTPDEIPPAISSVTSSVSGSGSATVAWNTNEPADSRVDYGTDPEALTVGQGSSTLATSHSVKLTGLKPTTTYYYRVSSSDAAGNSSSDPASPAAPRTFMTSPRTFEDTTVSDFSVGAPDSNTQVSQIGDGELILTPTLGEDFSGGPDLPAGWTSCLWTSPETCTSGSGSVSGGSLHVDGTAVRTTAAYGPGRSLEFVASFGGQSFEHAGFAADLNSSQDWALFSVNGSGGFFARTNGNGPSSETQLSSSLLGSPHRYRIEWGASEVRYYVDGTLAATQAADFGTTQMRPTASDFTAGGPEISLDWVHMSSFAESGTFESRVFDAGQTAQWGALSWGADTPAGTSVTVSVRTGDTATPDQSWSAFSPIAASGNDVPGASRYIQYRAQLSTSDPASTPTLNNVSITYSTPPDTTISSGPSGLINDPTPTFEFSSSEPGSSFECRFDSVAFAPCSGPGPTHTPTTPLADGPHTFEVRAVDQAGNADPTPAARSFTVDTQAPETTIASGPSGPINTTAAAFEFSSEPGAALQCNLDGAAFSACSSPQSYSALADGPHTFEVRAVDQAGNADPTPAARSFTVDTQAPETTIASGPSGPINTTAAAFEFSSEPGAALQCNLDGAAFSACSSPQSYSALADGPHSFEVRAIDQAGNADPTPAARSFTVDTQAPAAPSLAATSPASPANNNSPKVKGSAEAGSVVRIYSTSDCGGVALATGSAAELASPGIAVSVPDNSTTTLRATATDVVGNLSACSAGLAYLEDSTPPETTISSGPSGPINTTAAAFEFSSEPGAALQCNLDGAAFSACSSPQSYSALADGPHTFEVRAVDQAGNADPTPAARSFTVDTQAPETTIASGPSGPINTTAAAFEFSSEPGAALQCNLDGAAFSACSSPQSYSALADGPHSFEVRAIDQAGNADPTPAARSFTVDTQAPAAPSLAATSPASPANNNSPKVKGSAEAGSVVRIYSTSDCGGVALATGSAAELASPGIAVSVPDNSTTTLRATATDVVGNLSACSAGLAYLEDSTPPETTISSGPSGPINVTSASFAFSSEAGTSLQCRLDGAAFSACSSPKSYSALADGPHSFEVRAIDQAGNADPTPAARSFTVDTQAPAAPSLAATSPASPANNNSPKVKGSAEAGSVVRIYSTSGCKGSPLATGGAAELASPGIAVSVPDNSTTTLRATATDVVGNLSACSAGLAYVEDSTPPDTTITSGPSGPTNNSTPTFGFSSSQSGSTFECRFDSAAFAPCSGPGAAHTPATPLPDGAHTFAVRAIDQAGNTDPTPATRSFSVDTQPPDTTITAGPSGNTSDRRPTFSFTSSVPGSTFQCSLDNSKFAACTSPNAYSNQSFGVHVFQVRAIDPAGNVDPTPAERSFTITR